MQTFSNFIKQRFGYNENIDQNQQVVPDKMIKKVMELKEIINIILNNPNYFKKFMEATKVFISDVKDNNLNNMMQNLQNGIKQNEKDEGLGQLQGALDKPNNLPPNMGG
jgi:hypothetical protein